ncbi:hypothetical protein TYRP_016209 [Tyrophagus putrescentiae]|nr:hypothetical protein TYRP_016209 [Tyrophagus putrescentiae]
MTFTESISRSVTKSFFSSKKESIIEFTTEVPSFNAGSLLTENILPRKGQQTVASGGGGFPLCSFLE